jgi:protein gp37
MKKHAISWLNIPGFVPQTWNPIVGCTKVSPGCANCYAETWANRLASTPASKEKYKQVIENGKWNGKTIFHDVELYKPLDWKKPRAIFVCSMGDLFHESIPFEQIDEIWDVMCCHPRHTYILLTKRPQRMLEFMMYLGDRAKAAGLDSIPTQSQNPLDYISVPDFIWIGVTAENQEQAEKRIPILLQIPAKVRFASCEPLLEEIDLQYWDKTGCPSDLIEGLDWVIVGGESGPNARPIRRNWVAELQIQCEETATPFFFKQWHKKSDGRLLYGKEYNEFPYIISES